MSATKRCSCLSCRHRQPVRQAASHPKSTSDSSGGRYRKLMAPVYLSPSGLLADDTGEMYCEPSACPHPVVSKVLYDFMRLDMWCGVDVGACIAYMRMNGMTKWNP